MEPSIFTRIVNGDVPAYKVFENADTLAFLDINPTQPGHMLVVPKVQVDRLEDLSETHYQALMTTVKTLMHHVVKVFGADYRACLKVEGFDVAHAHVHIIPCRTGKDFWVKQRTAEIPDHTALARMAERLKLQA